MLASWSRASLCVALAALVHGGAVAQASFYRALTGSETAPTYAAAVPAPETLLGWEIGDRYSFAGDLLRYATAVAAASDRVQVERFGASVDGRPLAIVWISSPANLARRTAIAAHHHAVANGAVAEPGDMPLTVWVGAGVHGNEAAAGEGCLAVIRHLAADDSVDTRRILDHVLLGVDLAQNPDGRDRFVATALDHRSTRGRETDPLAWDHTEPWPGGRVNHHLFDLNRDWFLQTQQETRARAAVLLRELPQIALDLHEMEVEQSYFFASPASPPLNQHTSASVQERIGRCGAAVRAAFDARGWSYFTGDVFPADYPGFGGAFPGFLGAASMTFEQASPRGAAMARRDGSLVTLYDAALHHATAVLATLTAAASQAPAFHRSFRDHFAALKAAGAADAQPLFLLTPRYDAGRVRELGATLARCGIVVDRLDAPLTLDAAPLVGAARTRTTVPAGTLVVDARQRFRPLVLALLDPHIVWPPAFEDAEAGRLARHEASEVYDVTGWNLPLLFGVEALRAESLPAETKLVRFDGEAAASRSNAPVATPPANRALLFAGETLAASRLLGALGRAGVNVRVLTAPCVVGDRSYGAGALLVLPDRNRADGAMARAVEIARANGIAWDAPAGMSAEGGHDLGTHRAVAVRAPRLTVVFGRPADVSSAGAIRWFLEERVDLRVLAVAVDKLAAALTDTDVLILPDGAATDWEHAVSTEELKGWLNRGGTIVSIRGATEFLTLPGVDLLPLKAIKAPDADRTLHGPVVCVRLDTDQWLGRGLPADLAIQARSHAVFEMPDRDEVHVHATYGVGAGLLLSGNLAESQAARLSGHPCIVERAVGRGRIVAFTEDPTLRGAAPGWFKVFANSILLSGSTGR